MALAFDRAHLRITLADDKYSSADLAFLIESIHNLTSAAIWATILSPQVISDELSTARGILVEATQGDRTGARFYPDFQSIFLYPHFFPFYTGISEEELNANQARPDFPFDLDNPLDVGTLTGINSWFRRQLHDNDREVYDRLFGLATIDRLEHHSPLVLEMGVVLTGALLIPAIVIYGLMRATAQGRRHHAEAEIREVEAQEKREVLRQRRIQTEILEELRDAIREARQRNRDFVVPPEVLVAAAQISSPSIADLSSSPLIDTISIGLTANAGK